MQGTGVSEPSPDKNPSWDITEAMVSSPVVMIEPIIIVLLAHLPGVLVIFTGIIITLLISVIMRHVQHGRFGCTVGMQAVFEFMLSIGIDTLKLSPHR
jgi:hypothetical protein